MFIFKLLRVALHIAKCIFVTGVIFPFRGLAYQEKFIRRWSAKTLVIFGIEVRVQGFAPSQFQQRALIVSNHVSWVDIFVINSLETCHFVAKSDILEWPLIGKMCERGWTIFLVRGKRADVRRIYTALVDRINLGERVAFFPEGTTAAQGTLLPFHSNLFEAAIEARVPILPFSVRYTDSTGALQHSVDYIGDTSFLESIIMMLKGGKIIAHVQQLPMISSEGMHRRHLANAARTAVAQSLGLAENATNETEGH
jgi:1-acyl-sn-glycerol-3-phosphate acyltransferase